MKFLVMCIGNPEGGDDAVGPYIAKKLKDKNIDVINCEANPENYTSVVKQKNPDKLIIIDAADMGLTPGEVRIVPKEKIGVMHISTHGIPVPVLINYLEQSVKEIVFIGIQPEKMHGGMTDAVLISGDYLIDIISDNSFNKIKNLR